MKGGSEKSEILCVGQLARAGEKVENSIFSKALYMEQISAKYFFKIYCQKISVLRTTFK